MLSIQYSDGPGTSGSPMSPLTHDALTGDPIAGKRLVTGSSSCRTGLDVCLAAGAFMVVSVCCRLCEPGKHAESMNATKANDRVTTLILCTLKEFVTVVSLLRCCDCCPAAVYRPGY